MIPWSCCYRRCLLSSSFTDSRAHLVAALTQTSTLRFTPLFTPAPTPPPTLIHPTMIASALSSRSAGSFLPTLRASSSKRLDVSSKPILPAFPPHPLCIRREDSLYLASLAALVMALLCFDLLSSCFFFAYGLFFWLCDYAACVTILALTSLLIFFFTGGVTFSRNRSGGINIFL